MAGEWLVQANWFDVAAVALVGLYAWQGWEKGLNQLLAEFVSWVLAWGIGLLGAQKLAGVLVMKFGLWQQSSWLWAFILIVVVVEMIVNKGLEEGLRGLPKQYFAGKKQFVMGIVPALLSGVMIIMFLVFLLIKIPVSYPLDTEIKGSWSAKWVDQQVEWWHEQISGSMINRQWL